MKKLLIILVLVVALLALLAGTAWWWLTQTRGGAEWALNRAAGQVETLTWQSLDGGLAGGITLNGVRFAQAGTRVDIDRLELAARIRPLSGPLVDVRWLRVNEIDVYLPETEDPETDPPDFDLSMLTSPVAVEIGQLQVRNLRIHPYDGEVIVVDRIAMAGLYSDRIELRQLEVETEQGSLTGSGHWAFTDPAEGRMQLHAISRIDEQAEQSVTIELTGTLERLTLAVQAEGPIALSGRAVVTGLPDTPAGQIELTGQFAGWPALDLTLDEVELEADGDLNDWNVNLAATSSGMDLPPGRWRIEASGSTRRILIHRLEGDVLDGQVLASGEVDFGGEFLQASAELALDDLDLTPLYPEWPEQARISGELAGAMANQEIRLERLSLRAPPTSLQVSGSGRFNPNEDDLELELHWQDFTWPPILDDSEPLLVSESGRMTLTGRISDWRLELDALLRQGDLPNSEVALRATGGETRADIEALSLILDAAGRLDAEGQIAWGDQPDARLNVRLIEFDPGVFVHQMPGKVNAQLAVDARRRDQWLFGITLDDLHGKLRNQPLAGQGRLAMTEDVPEAARLELSLGNNRLEVESEEGRQWRWRLDGEALHQLWPDIEGMAQLNGTFEPYSRRLAASGQLESGGFGEFALTSAEIEAELHWGEETRAEVVLALSELDLNPWERIDRLEMNFSGDCDLHRLQLNLSGQRGSLDLEGNGRLEGCLAPDRIWHGTIEHLYLGETLAGNWQLGDALPIRVADQDVRAGPGCLRSVGNGSGRICLDDLLIDGHSSASIRVEQVPMDLLLLPLDPVFSLTTPLSGELRANWSAQGVTQLGGHLELGAGALIPVDGKTELLTVDSVRLDFTPDNDHGLIIDLLARLEGQTELTSRAQVFDLRDPASAQIEAEGQLDLPDIGAFNHLVIELDQLGGRLAGHIQLQGTLGSPDFDGQVQLIDGHLAHAPLGLKVTDIDIELEGRSNQATLRGSMRSGEGTLNLAGQLDQQADGWKMVLDLDGSSVALADVDWLRLTTSPRINLVAQAGRLDIDGDIRVDRLRAGLPPGAGERIAPSPDVVIRGEEVEEDVEPPIRRLHGRLGIDLGDDARLSAEGLQTQLAGGIELLWNGPPEPRARGAIRLPDGSYRAYGQLLEINDGEILFTGQPIDNPRLNIRAVRDIFGDPRVDIAGVHIRGPAQNPQIDLFTTPPTSDEKALAYMVTGSDFDHATGQGAVNVGFYLLPRLFVSYGFGLFEAGNVLSGRYELGKRWGIRVVSGERDTGVDLGYIVDR